MFVLRRIIRKNKHLTNFIYTTNVVNDDKPAKVTEKVENTPPKHRENNKNASANPVNISDIPVEVNVLNAERKNFKKKTRENRQYKKALTDSVKNVAKHLGGDHKKTTEEILTYLKDFQISGDIQETPFNERMSGLKPSYLSKSVEKLHYGTTSLNIFKPDLMEEAVPQVKLKIWDHLEAEEMACLSKFSPRNHFEEMINWTNEGKLWHFPIDNDQGMEREAKTSFTEHIFMEKYLEPWCPKRGPLKKFMELVMIGLSKNYHYTVEEKKAHINWFRNYFEEKKKLLQQLGAMGSATESKKIETFTSETNK